jgi:uncharacterized membrane protein YbhN (UPF0104 family)
MTAGGELPRGGPPASEGAPARPGATSAAGRSAPGIGPPGSPCVAGDNRSVAAEYHGSSAASRPAPQGSRAAPVSPRAAPAWRWPPSRRTLIRGAVVLFLLVALVVVGRKFWDMKEFLATLATFEPVYLAPILSLGLVYYLLKALRWHYYLREAKLRVPVQRSVAAYMAGQWFTFTPAGELMRACLLGAGVEVSLVAPTVVAQAIADFVSLALVATVVVPLYPELAPVVLPVTVPLLTTVAMLAFPPLREYASSWRLVRWLASGKRREMVGSAAHLLGPRPMGVGVLMGIPAVLAGGLSLYYAGRAVGLPNWNPLHAEGVYAIIQLLGGLSPLPQGLGVTEGSGTLLLSYLGVDPAEALAAIVLFRAAILGFSAVVGLLAFFVLRGRD